MPGSSAPSGNDSFTFRRILSPLLVPGPHNWHPGSYAGAAARSPGRPSPRRPLQFIRPTCAELPPLGGAIDNADWPIGADILVELQRCVGNGATAAIMNSRTALPPPDPSVQGTRPDETGTVRDPQDLLTTAAVQRFLGAGGSSDEPEDPERMAEVKRPRP